jgi:hypothetical protein
MGALDIVVSQIDTAVLAGLILYCYDHINKVENKIKILEDRLSDLELVVSEQ